MERFFIYKPGSRNGYTLLELLCVLALMGILSALAVPRLIYITHWELEGAARAMAADIRLVQQEAIVHGECTEVYFLGSHDSYQLRLPNVNRMVYLPEGVNYEGQTSFPTDPFLKFNYLGAPGGGGTVTLQTKSGSKRYVIVTPVTGRVRVSKTPPSY